MITADGSTAYVALGRANHVAVVDVQSREVLDTSWSASAHGGWSSADEKMLYVANGLSDDLTVIDTESRRNVLSIPVGMVPYGILVDDR